MSNLFVSISFKKHSHTFELSPNTTTKTLYEMVGAKFGIDPNKIKILKNEKLVKRDQTEISSIPHDDDKIELEFRKLEKNEEFDQIKNDFLKFCIGREPKPEDIEKSEKKDVDEALKQIYEGNEELRKCGFVFVPEYVTKPKNQKAEIPDEAKYKKVYDMNFEQMQMLNEMGFNDNRTNGELIQKHGWRPERIVNDLIQKMGK